MAGMRSLPQDGQAVSDVASIPPHDEEEAKVTSKSGASLSHSGLPDVTQSCFEFTNAAYFKKHGNTLPESESVKSHDLEHTGFVIIKEQDLFIKYGNNVNLEEAVVLSRIHKYLDCSIPVPEVYGWRKQGKENFIYMELIDGVPLSDCIGQLSNEDKDRVCSQLRTTFTTLSTLKQDSISGPFIGSIIRGPLRDKIFDDHPATGPFATLDDFYDWLEYLPQRSLAAEDRYTDPYVDMLPTNADIKFTHGDLHPSNIIISETSPRKVLALIDWEQAGWYPDYWESFKSSFAAGIESQWFTEWVPKIIDVRDDVKVVMAEYSMQIAPV